MNQAGEDEQIAALRERIRQAGRVAQQTRQAIVLSSWWLFAAVLILTSCGWVLFHPVTFRVACATVIIGAVGSLVGLGTAAGYRTLKRRQLRAALTTVERQQAIPLLAPLWEEGGDTRKIVAPLLRELRVSSEVAPAAGPTGRGDEISPAGAEPKA